MSQAKLTLRPPPNIDFVQGYPGIPPGAADRPQAAVKGAIEVRLGPQGVKAKYVRVELRKIESLPGLPPNSYYDFVGQSPVNLWQSSEEYSILYSQDIPFYIRIPESIPPTLALENGAGIKYELVGQVCIQGKSGFFRRNKPVVLSSSTPIIIDKHELHSTWPVFQQHESRHLTQDAVMLTVDRSQNCYGPGDRVMVHATIRSDSTHTTILRGFEFTLKETTIFRAGPHVAGRSGAPQVKINIIGEQKALVNMTMHSGMVHRSELAVMVPQTHTTTTLTSARHIDITYVLVVKALMGTGKPLIMELPVIVSNWPRYVSTEAVRRIGIAPSLSLQQPVVPINSVTNTGTRPRTAPDANQAATVTATSYPYSPTRGQGRDPRLTNTVPNSAGAPTHSDEMGFIPRPNSDGDEPQAQQQTESNSSSARRRSRTGSAVPQSNRFTVANMTDNEIPEDGPHTNTPGPTEILSPAPPQQPKAWPTAEEEKARLYQEAKARVERVQGGLDRAESVRSTNGYPTQSSPQSSIHSAAPQVDTTRWASAEEEKIRLFTQAQNNARIMQGYVQDLNDVSRAAHGRGASRDSSRSFQQGVTPGRPPVISAGAALYSHAMASVNKPNWGSPATTPLSVPPSESHPPLKPSRLPTAAEEKEMLRRYHDAARAVQRHHEVNFGSSDGIMPSASSTHGATAGPYSGHENNSAPTPDELPPPWVPSLEFSQTDGMSEKERYRIASEARERAVAAAEQQLSSPPPASPTTSPPADYYTATGTPHPDLNGSDPRVPADSGLPPPWHPTPPPAQSGLPPHLRSRSPPVPPSNPAQPGQLRILSAAEEKALLKARYEAEEQSTSSPAIPQRQQGYHTSPSTPPSSGLHSPIRSELPVSRDQTQVAIATPPRTPPPLMPRPPASYIQETAEEDARLQDELANGKLSATVDGATIVRASVPLSVATPGIDATGLDDTFGLLRPTSPFTVGWESVSARTAGAGANDGLGSSLSSPPPLPPKVPLEH